MRMSEGTKVTWTTASGVAGSGRTISDECPEGPFKGHIIVAKDAAPGEEHPVIFCAVTWLTMQPEALTHGS